MTPVPDRDAALDVSSPLCSAGRALGGRRCVRDCLDPETAAAMADGGLSPSEQAVVAEHALTCARCRSSYRHHTNDPGAAGASCLVADAILAVAGAGLATGLAVAVGRGRRPAPNVTRWRFQHRRRRSRLRLPKRGGTIGRSCKNETRRRMRSRAQAPSELKDNARRERAPRRR